MDNASPTDQVTIRLPRALCVALHDLCLYAAGENLRGMPFDTLHVLAGVLDEARSRGGLILEADLPQEPDDPNAPERAFDAYFAGVITATEAR